MFSALLRLLAAETNILHTCLPPTPRSPHHTHILKHSSIWFIIKEYEVYDELSLFYILQWMKKSFKTNVQRNKRRQKRKNKKTEQFSIPWLVLAPSSVSVVKTLWPLPQSTFFFCSFWVFGLCSHIWDYKRALCLAVMLSNQKTTFTSVHLQENMKGSAHTGKKTPAQKLSFG